MSGFLREADFEMAFVPGSADQARAGPDRAAGKAPAGSPRPGVDGWPPGPLRSTASTTSSSAARRRPSGSGLVPGVAGGCRRAT